MKSRIKTYMLMLALMLPAIAAKAQTGFSLNKALEYALINNENIKNAQLATLDAEAQVFETRADGLPQITAGFNYTNNLFIAKSPIPASFITGNPNAEGVVLVGFGAQHLGNLNFGMEQMLWDGSFFIGLKAARLLREKVIVDKAKAEVDVIEQVTKAYYLVLVNQTRVDLIDVNLDNLNTILDETKTLYENGFAERIDVSRLQVQVNNLLAEKSGVEQAVKTSQDLLKLSMGMSVEEAITLTDRLEALDFNYELSELRNFSLNNRLEVQQLDYLKELAGLQIKNTTSQYIPKVSFNAGWGRNTGSNDFSDLMDSKKWFSSSQIGLNVSIPIFDGLRKKYTIQRNRIELETLNNQYSLLTNSLTQQLQSAKRNLDVSLEQLDVQKANMELAQDVSNITKEKYKEGVGSNLEVTNAEKDYKEAETNYLNALYNAIIAKVDLDKALGKLKNNDN
ncbi:TolC family protein [Roseivirga echinicomitans]